MYLKCIGIDLCLCLFQTRCLSGLRPSIARLQYGLQWLEFGCKMLLFAKTQILKWYPDSRFGESDDLNCWWKVIHLLIKVLLLLKGLLYTLLTTIVWHGDMFCLTRVHFCRTRGTSICRTREHLVKTSLWPQQASGARYQFENAL